MHVPDAHIAVQNPRDEECAEMLIRMEAFIFPNIARTEAELAALQNAISLQIAHEKTLIAQCGGNALPEGIRQFAVGSFSATLDAGTMSGRLTRRSICPYAYGVLLKAGLLYKGVERGM